jgi:hypothetical protein
MTLLDEYQALPGEPVKDLTRDNGFYFARYEFNRVLRRDAVIRLLCRALRDLEDEFEYRSLWDEYAELLAAVERDFPEGV